MADTMMHFDNGLSTTILSEDELRKVCPYAFKTEPTNPKVSEKYVQATTIDVVRDMAELGWYPVEAKQCRNRKGSSGIRSFHAVVFQNPDIKVMNGDDVEAYPRIILTNSHDGFNAFKFMVGLYRTICSNGLIIADAEYENFSIRHINYTQEELRAVVCKAVEALPNKINVISDMMNVELTDEQKSEFVVNAVREKKGNNQINLTEEEITDILTPLRAEDEGNSVYNIFNIIQEKIIKGGYSLSNGKKSRRQRGIKSIKKDLEINSKLYNMAVSYLPEAIAA